MLGDAFEMRLVSKCQIHQLKRFTRNIKIDTF